MRRSILTSVLCFMTIFTTPVSGTAKELTPLPSSPVPGRYLQQFKSEGFTRSAYLHIPKGYRQGTKPPLVLIFHGAGGNGRGMLDRNGWAAKADREGFIAVAPNGLPALPRQEPNFLRNPPLWNSGQLLPRSPRAQINDVAFIEKLLDDLMQKIPYDKQRVFCAGHSNGAGMTFRLANEISKRFAAIAVVAGQVAIDDPHPKVPMPTLAIFGKEDTIFPIQGGETKLPWGTRTTKPVAAYLSAWAKGLGCKTTPKTLSDKDGVLRVEYPSTSKGPTLTAVYLESHGHHWPGAPKFLPKRMIGPISKKLNATNEIWTFFQESIEDSGKSSSCH